MKFPSYKTIRHLLALLLAFLTASAPALAQEKKVAQQNGVDNSKWEGTAPWRNTSMRTSTESRLGSGRANGEGARKSMGQGGRLWRRYGAFEDESGPVRTDRQGHGRFYLSDHQREGQSTESCQGKGHL